MRVSNLTFPPRMTVLTKNEQIAAFRQNGFVVVPGLVDAARCASLRAVAADQLARRVAPLEFEADLQYPGAPASRAAAGGETVRRLLDAFGRDRLFAQWMLAPEIRGWMEMYFGEPVVLSRAHHNCIMTKHPDYGSLTGWHRDARYWSFERDDLVSVWLALGPENAQNGGLWLVPASHALDFEAARFDHQKFFRADMPENEALIRLAQAPKLQPGDVVFFHCNTLHAAGRNLSDAVKFSVVSTYHGVSNAPRPGTRSASVAGERLPQP